MKKLNFTTALRENIESTFTYAHARNLGYSGTTSYYDPIDFFTERAQHDPFGTFTELNGYAFKSTLNALNKYEIPYTAEQKRKARIYYDITEKMKSHCSDIVYEFIEDDLAGTGIVRIDNTHGLTTKETIAVNDFIRNIPYQKKTDNILYKKRLNPQISSATEQLNAVKTCLEHKTSCLIGGAGTGKSFVTASIIDQLQANRKKVAVLAPTHKAREALQDRLRGEGIKNEVRTIHSFVHNPSPCEAIVIDESGMLSTPLFHMLIRNYKDQHLVFVGDKNQLPPVDYGRPFELLQDIVEVAELKKNYRSESADIIALGREILGLPYNANIALNNIHKADTIEEAFQMGAEVGLSFMNQSVGEINENQRLKQGSDSISRKFKIGEKIIAKTNQKNKFYNGQLFEVTGYSQITNLTTRKTINVDNWRDLDYNFDYAYGLTIHKSQGSEWDTVAYQPGAYDTENLAYVAVTRAKKKLIIVGGDINPKPEKQWTHSEDYKV